MFATDFARLVTVWRILTNPKLEIQMSETTYEAANLEAALAQAAENMGAAAADLQYEVVEEKRDFWGGDEGTVVIKAWLDAEPEPEVEVEDEAGAPETVAAPETVTDDEPGGGGSADGEDNEAGEEEAEEPPPLEADEEVADALPEEAPAALEPEPAVAAAADDGEEVESESVAALLRQIFHDMDFDCQIEIERQEDGFLVAVTGADQDLLLEGNGRCLSALELILNNAFRHQLPSGQKVRVDAGDFRSRREEELADLAFQIAHSAKDTGETQETQPLNPYERRLVHLALADDSGVTTRSRGNGFLKNVQVIPHRGGGDRSTG